MSNPRRTPPRAKDPVPLPEPASTGPPEELYVPSRLRQNKVFTGLRNAFVLALCAYGVDQFARWYSEYDKWLYWFVILAVWRYARFILNCIGWVLYKPAPLPKNPTYIPNRDVTAILPTVDPTGVDFKECISTCAENEPASIIVITAGDELFAKTINAVKEYIDQYPKTKFVVDRAMIASKRAQLAVAVPMVKTAITVMLDDHVFWKKNFLRELLAPFEDPEVGLVGTNKNVRRLPNLGLWRRIWNMLGATYLYRHNFEVRAANYWDGGAFVISARTCALRTRIVADPEYLAGYVDERFFFGLCGPLNPDDDNYNTRFAVRKGWRIKFQYTDDAEIETTVGVADPVHKKFLGQCTRWARTTWRSNPCSLFTDGSVWAYQPYCVYAVYLTSFTNFALFTDAGLFTLYNWTNRATLTGNLILGTWILFVKFVKIFGYYKRHPQDIWTFPAYLFFAYYHSFIKLWALCTFYNHAWTGRNLGAIKTQANPAGTEAGNTAGAPAVVTNLQRSMSVASMTSSLVEERERLKKPTAWMHNLGENASRFQKSQDIFGGNQVTVLEDIKTVGDYMTRTKKSQYKIIEQQTRILKELEKLIKEAEEVEELYNTMNANESRNQDAFTRLRGQLLLLEGRQRELIRTAGTDIKSPPLSPAATRAVKTAAQYSARSGGSAIQKIPTFRMGSLEDSTPRPSFITGTTRTPQHRQIQQVTGQSGGIDFGEGSSTTPRATGPVLSIFDDSFPPPVGKDPNPIGGGKFSIPTIPAEAVDNQQGEGGTSLFNISPRPAVWFGSSPSDKKTPAKHEEPKEEFSPVGAPSTSPSGFTPAPKKDTGTGSEPSTTPRGEPSSSTTPETARRSAGSEARQSPTPTPRPKGGRKGSKEEKENVSAAPVTPQKREEAPMAPNNPRTPESNPLLRRELEQ